MAYNRAELRKIIYGYLEDNRGLRDSITASLNNSNTSFTANDYEKYFDGGVIEIDSEVMYVKGDPSTSTVSVWERGDDNTTAASHSSGARVRINPKWFNWQLDSCLNDCLVGRVYKEVENTTAITTTASTRKYDLPAAIKIENILAIYLRNSDNTKGELIKRVRGYKKSGTSSVDQLEFLDVHTASRYIWIKYLTGFTAFSADNVDCDLPDNETAQMIPVYWACASLIEQKESPRLRKDRGQFKKSSPPLGARLQVGGYWSQRFISACRSAGLHPNIPGAGPVVTKQTIISEY